jgi:hypothetical protein
MVMPLTVFGFVNFGCMELEMCRILIVQFRKKGYGE